MNKMARNILMLAAAGYIIYTGIMTIRSAVEGEVSSNTTFIVIGTVFIVFGIAAFIFYAKSFFKAMKEENVVVDDDDDSIEVEETEESTTEKIESDVPQEEVEETKS